MTWVIPHSFGFVQPAEVDMRLMSIFVEFYTCVLGFVNFRLYHSLNLSYPPQLSTVTEAGEADMEDRVGALNQSLKRIVVDEDENMDNLESIAVADEERMKEAVAEREMKEKQSNLFKGLKFFLGREVPREPLVFMIRAVGGEVSWDSSVGVGATFPVTEDTITHQVMDRESSSAGDMILGRFYIQPQWIFDSINRRERCREKDFALGETLPPHLSPFVSERERRVGDYVPPEQKALEENTEEPDNSDENEAEDSGHEEEADNSDVSSSDSEEAKEVEEVKMGVKVGVMEKFDDDHEKKMEEDEEYKLRVMMIKKKHRNLYKSMMKNRRKRIHESKLKESKRKEWEDQKKSKAKKKSA